MSPPTSPASRASPTSGSRSTDHDELDRRTVERALAALFERGRRHQQGLSPRTVVHTHAVLHRALQDAVLDGLLADNPAHQARRPRRDPGAVDPDEGPQVWSATEITRQHDDDEDVE